MKLTGLRDAVQTAAMFLEMIWKRRQFLRDGNAGGGAGTQEKKEDGIKQYFSLSHLANT